jgi:hypothetical protein
MTRRASMHRAVAGILLSVVAAGLLPRTAHADLAACIASSEQGLTLRRAGKLRAARTQLASCGSPPCPDELRAECVKRMEGVNAAMPTLIIDAKDGKGGDVLGVEITVDGVAVAAALDGRPVEVDPGEHTVRVTATGLPPGERTIVVREGEKNRHESFLLGEAPIVAPVDAAKTAPAPRPWGARQTIAVVVGGGGVVGIGVGAAFGLLASSEWSSSKSASGTQNSCTSVASCAAHTTAVNDHDTAVTDATISTIAFGVGAALVVAGVVTWFTAPSREAPPAAPAARLRFAPAPLRDGGSLTVLGEF